MRRPLLFLFLILFLIWLAHKSIAMRYINMQDKNLQAFLKVIRFAEGTAGPNGYRTLFGGGLFNSYHDHPRIMVSAGGYNSTAAGAYQILASTWDDLKATYNDLTDFGPANQDKAAVYLIRQRGALADVKAGNFAAAIEKTNGVWASLPGSPYGQPVKTLAELQAIYNGAGGTYSA